MLATTEVPRPLDATGRRRSPATLPGYHAGRPPRNKGMRYPADPPRVEEIVAVMRQAGTGVHGTRVRSLIVVLWRGGLSVAEALSLAERDLDPERGSLIVRRGKGGRRREVGMDEWGWEQLRAWLEHREPDADRALVLHRLRARARTPLVGNRSAHPATASGCPGWRSPPFRPASAAPCARG